MKKFLIITALVVGSLAPLGVSAKASTVKTVKPAATVAVVHHPVWCGTTPYDVAYGAVYTYPTGSYWQGQIAAYPAYYAANNAYYLATYGC